jgi:hypothetical protein
MSIPPFEPSGNLPPGVHAAALADFEQRFGKTNATRQALYVRLQRIYDVARSTGCLGRFIVFGSFVTTKVFPNDVDAEVYAGSWRSWNDSHQR